MFPFARSLYLVIDYIATYPGWTNGPLMPWFHLLRTSSRIFGPVLIEI